jgi:putative oxidoreductase
LSKRIPLTPLCYNGAGFQREAGMESGFDLASWLLQPWHWNLAIGIGRVAIGVCFVIHGLGKLGIVGTGNMAGFVEYLRSLGVPMPHVQARMAMLSELCGGSLLALGLLTRPACLLLIVTMIVAGRLGHKGAGYLITNNPPGAEYTINLAVICGLFLLTGPGMVSLDYLLFG